jgi:N-carbamoylputrescine amidase
MADKFIIGLVQMHCTADAEENLTRAIEKIREAAARGAQIISLHELFRSEYFCRKEDATLFDLAEPVPGPATQTLAQIAKERKVVLVASLFERRAAGVYHNTAVVIDAGGTVAGRYRKMHIPDDPRFYEKFYFTPGDLGFLAHPTAYGSVGVLVCWDQWFPEAARLTAMSGAPVLFYPTAIGWDLNEVPQVRARQLAAWETVQRGHAIANGVFVVAVNRVGVEDGLQFWGSSFVSDPFGEVIARGDATAEETMVVQCDLSLVEETRRNWPFLRDRRIDAYADLTRRLRSE